MLDKITLDINLAALEHNYKTLCTLHPNSSKTVFAVVKSDAYGLGVNAVVKYLNTFVYGFSVSTIAEALHIRDIGITKPILVLTGWYSTLEYQQAIKQNLILTIATIEQAEFLVTNHTHYGKPHLLYFKIDSGMSRLGLSVKDIDNYLPKCIDVMGCEHIVLMSHFACSDDVSHSKNNEQISILKQYSQKYNITQLSMNNSGGIIHHLMSDTYPRGGIALYGGYQHSLIQPVVSLQAPIIAIRSLNTGDTIGYSATYTCSKPMKIAILGIGYSSGIMRNQTGGKVYIAGEYAEILGVISMEMIAVDVSHIAKLSIDDKVEIFGEHVNINEVAKNIGTISYELLTHLHSSITRNYHY